MKEEFYDKFPCVLRKSLKGGSVNSPEDMKKEFREFTAYRGITRKGSVEIQINKNDFLSQMEKFRDGKIPRGINSNDIGYYSCSLFLNKQALNTAMKLPRSNLYIIKGYVTSSKGVVSINNGTHHVNWWLYKDTDPSNDFKILGVV